MRRRRALVVAALAVVGPASAAAAAPDDEAVELRIVEQDFAVDLRGAWRATVELSGVAAPEEAELRIVVYRPIEERARLAEAIVDGPSGLVDSITVPLPAPRAGLTGPVEVAVDAPTSLEAGEPDALTMRRPGLYPTLVQVRVRGEVLAEHLTFVERLASSPSSSPPLNVAIVAAVADPGPGLETAAAAASFAALGDAAQLAERVDAPLTLALPPVLLTDFGTPTGPARLLRDALADDEVLAVPAEPLDPSSAVAIDAQSTFISTLIDGEEAISAALPDVSARRSAWLTTSALSTGAARFLRGLDFDLLVLDPATYGDLEGNIGGYVDVTMLVDVDLDDDAPIPAIVTHPIGRLLDVDRDDAPEPVDAAVRILAELVTTRRELGPGQRRSVVLATPDVAVPDPAVAAQLADLAADLPDVRLTTLSTLASSTDVMELSGRPATVSLPATAGPDLSGRAERIERAHDAAESAGSMQVDDGQLQRWREELDGMLSTALTDDEVDATLARIADEAATVRAAVEAPNPFDFTLTGRSSSLRFNLRNGSDEVLRVVVRARSPKLTFPEGDRSVELQPNGLTEVVLPVEARTNGTSSIDLEVLTPRGDQQVTDPVVLTAHVNALTGLGQVITGGALLVLGSWWFGHFRRRRRLRMAAGAPAMLDVVSPDAGEAADDDLTKELVDVEPRE